MAARTVAALAVVVAVAAALRVEKRAANHPRTFTRGHVQAHPFPFAASISTYRAASELDDELPQFYRGAVEANPFFDPVAQSYSIGFEDPQPDASIKSSVKEYSGGQDSQSSGSEGLQQSRYSSHYKIVCYVESWARKRSPPLDFNAGDFDAYSCTHLIYASAGLDEETLEIKALDAVEEITGGAYKSYTKLKESNPSLNIMISVGGWNENGRKYSTMVSTKENRQKFIASVVSFLNKFEFDGLDLNWEYPGATDRGGRKGDKENFALLVEELSHEFAVNNWVLSATVPAMSYRIEQGYDVPKLATYLDFISVETYDLRGSWDGFADHHAPIQKRMAEQWGYETLNLRDAMKNWEDAKAPKFKLVAGIPSYARTFTLENPENHAPGSRARGGGRAGALTNTRGMLSYSEVCQNFRDDSWTKRRDDVGSPYMYQGNQWIGYDDEDYIALKTGFVAEEGYAGAAMWALDLDDYLGLCGPRWPLLNAIKAGLSGPYHRPPPPEPVAKVVCYFESWVAYRSPPYAVHSTREIDPSTCTHMVYAFAGLQEGTHAMVSLDQDNDVTLGGYKAVSALKRSNPALKVLIAVGGWNEGGRKFSIMAASTESRKMFIDSVVEFLKEYNYDGVTLDWEYPGAPDRGGRQGDAANLALLVQELSVALTPLGCAVSLVVPPARYRVDQGYDVPAMARYLDFISVATYDLRGHWDGFADNHAPLEQRGHDGPGYETLNVKDAMQYWVDKGAPRSMLLLGVPMYARTFTLTDPAENVPGSKVIGAGSMGAITKDSGMLAYFEVCQRLADPSWSRANDSAGSPYIFRGDQWIGFDDESSIAAKMNFVAEEGYGGAAVWAVDLDDYLGVCGQRWPLMTALVNSLNGVQEEFRTSSAARPSFRLRAEGQACTPKQDTFQEVPGNCQAYLQCVNGVVIRFKCNAPLQWNQMKQICDWESEVKCKAGSGAAVVTEDTLGATSSKPATERPPAPSTTETTSTTQWSWTSAKPTTTLATMPPTTKDFGEYKSVCYYTNWAWYRQGQGSYLPDHIDTSLCTHLVYGFAVLDPSTLLIKPHDTWADIDRWNKKTGYKKVLDIVKVKNDGTKVLLAIGGWNDSKGDKYSKLVRDPAARRRFITHVITYMDKYGFHGLDLDWEYPKCWQVDCEAGPVEDKQNFAAFVSELRQAFDATGRKYLLSAAVSPSSKVIDEGYDVPSLNRDLDWIAVMTYDYHGQWDKKTGHVAPMYVHPDDDKKNFNMDYTMKHWLKRGADKKKLILGMPLYGQSFTLTHPSNNTGLNAPAKGGGNQGTYTRAKGFLAYYEICDLVQNRGWNVVKDPLGTMGPYAYKGNQWVSFDDRETIRQKSQYIVEHGYGGGMVWALDLDDFTGQSCGEGKHPLMNEIKTVLTGAARSGSKPSATNLKEVAPIPVVPSTAPTTTPSTTSTALSTTTNGFVNPWTLAEAGVRPASLRGAPCSMGQFEFHEQNCAKFYQCVHAKFMELECLPGQHWAGTRCDWPENASCKVSPVSIPLPPGVAAIRRAQSAL